MTDNMEIFLSTTTFFLVIFEAIKEFYLMCYLFNELNYYINKICWREREILCSFQDVLVHVVTVNIYHM